MAAENLWTTDPRDALRAGPDFDLAAFDRADAAVAAAATLGVTEPYSAGIGGGGFFAHYDAGTGAVSTIDGRETAPAAMGPDAFVEGGAAIPFADAVSSGLSVGVPGMVATWAKSIRQYGRQSFAQDLRPAIKRAQQGFTIDNPTAGSSCA